MVQPTINLTSAASTTTEAGKLGTYRINRNTTSGDLTLKLTIDRSSSASVDDYNLSEGNVTVSGRNVTVVIPDGQSFVDINLTALNDIAAEANETVKLNLVADDAYLLGTKRAATITIARNDTIVINTNNNGEGSLRQAIENANLFAGANTIDFGGTVFTDATSDTIRLTSGQLNITDDLTIAGTEAKSLTVSGNNASRVFNIAGTGKEVNLDELTIANGNAGTGNGGGILVNSGNSLSLTDSTLSKNTAERGGAIANLGTATVTNTTVDSNQAVISGGSIYNFSNLTVTGSTLSNNQADGNGGGFTNTFNATVINSTLSGNQANGSGGGIFNSATLNLTNDTIANNKADADNDGVGDGGGVFKLGGNATASNTIIATNSDLGGEATDVFGSITGNANNLIGSTDGAFGTIGTGSDIVNANPGLAPLADNGGPTQTQALLAGSAAISAGNNALIPAGVTTDQRGEEFDRIKFGTVDIGAYEVQKSIVSLSAIAPTATETGTEGTYRISRTDSIGDLAVQLKIDSSSSASLNDYTLAGNNLTISGNTLTVTIPDGQSFVDLNLTAIDNIAAEADETLKLNLAPDAAYTIDNVNPNATVTIARNDTVVTNTNDSGEGSLRQALLNANAFSGANTVSFDTDGAFATAQTITLTSGQLNITDDVTIEGTGANQLTVSGNNASRVFNISKTGTDARINGLTIANGNAGVGDGGGILLSPSSTLILTDSILEKNRGTLGGGLSILGTATVINSTLSNNQADAGGGLLNIGNTTVINTTLSSNLARVFGGGGIGNLGTITLLNDTITNNTVTVNFNSTFGGGVENFFGGVFTVKNSIVAGNLNSNNQAADVETDFDGITGDANNLIGATNGALGTIGTGSDITFAEAGITNINQVLNPTLQNNGGTTPTYALVPTSPVINAGNNANLSADTTDLDGDGNTAEPIPVDQRGDGFNRIKFATLDIGAYESDTVSASEAQKELVIPRGEGSHAVLDFGGFGEGNNPTPSEAILTEIDTLQFVGDGLTARNLLLTQQGANLEITFEGVSDTNVILQNFALANLEVANTGIGNVIFDDQTSVTNSFDIVNAEFNGTTGDNSVIFLNDLDNTFNSSDVTGDVVNGQGGDDTLNGLSGDDLLRGGVGNDTLIGSAGNDILVGGADDDSLQGDIGQDLFTYQTFNDRGTSGDTVTDFNPNQDTLVLTNVFKSLGYSGSNPVSDGYLRFTQVGANAQVQIDANGGADNLKTLTVLNNVLTNSLVLNTNVLG
ncbi:MAG TPA: hypothetical protein DEV81_20585 [Cyanobacteria bacterium UBA11049]|nr:hypothetical protein [Cyanobacteria bacterium UBA11049]